MQSAGHTVQTCTWRPAAGEFFVPSSSEGVTGRKREGHPVRLILARRVHRPLYFAYVAVGALNVGSIEISGKAGYFEHNMHTPYEYSAGEEVGQFHFGSTIVLVYEVPVTHKVIYLAEEQKSIRVGDEFVLITKQQG